MTATRHLATQVLYQVVIKGQHLKAAMKSVLPDQLPAQDQAWIQHACYVSLRHHYSLTARWQKHLKKPLKDLWVGELLTLSLAQKFYMETPDHAIVNEAIKTVRKNKKNWASGLVNKVLRLAINDQIYQPETPVEQFEHPQWWIDILKKDWPDDYLQILQANNQKPPLWVRNKNPAKQLAGQQHPEIPTAWLMSDHKASGDSALHGGQYSVQDAAAQLSAMILDPQPGERILDACAAPGGKSCHLLERQPNIVLDILEKEPGRLDQVKSNLTRLQLTAHQLICGDATQPETWYSGEKYDKILLDVPCSATGVVRRNPDIKISRKAEHLKPLTALQQDILQTMSALLKPGGLLLYATCSVFRSENERQIKKFLSSKPDFSELPLQLPGARTALHGQQIITGTDDMDGFYYCLLSKQS
ncbi:16S rRNA (cytosine(967)-C(5))-methyltransferase RsmB [Marinicella sediminis]|uniref:16S rRNA (cytosine(967)-C(5))-methyltransferase n=1 Tax=Marinicella sediminis TaxID=1792834 RepID=A0ABV7JD28_9GAMM|nr:16S rRNA (cytosine(967)-C(5))-methyltransferase RsmB [Marinicella sediminis]